MKEEGQRRGEMGKMLDKGVGRKGNGRKGKGRED